MQLLWNYLVLQSDQCRAKHSQHKGICSQMGVLRQLATVDFRKYTSQLSFSQWATEWAVELAAVSESMPTPQDVAELAPAPNLLPDVAELAPKLSVEELSQLLESSGYQEMMSAVASVEEALQIKDEAGSFLISKQNGRPKLQNKLKRVKARLADMSPGPQPSKEEAPRASDEVEMSCEEYMEVSDRELSGSGCLDVDGYHGAWELDRGREGMSWSRCRSMFHVFVSYPRSVACPTKPWCTTVHPAAFCSLSEGWKGASLWTFR